MKVWVKIALVNSLVLIFLALLIALAMRKVVIHAVQSHSLAKEESVALTIADRIANSLLLGDKYITEQSLSDVLKITTDIEYIFVVDLEGELFASTFKNGYPPGLLNWNPLHGAQQSVQLLETENGYINDIGVSFFRGTSAELHIGIQGSGIEQSLEKIRNIIIILTAIVAMLGTLISFLFSRLLTQPLQKLMIFAKTLSQGEFGKTIPPSSSDEIGELTEAFNTLSQELKINKEKMKESYRQMCMTEKLTTMARLSAGLAHELRNPLTAIKILCNTVNDPSELTTQDMSVVLSEISYMDNILARFLNFANSDNLEKHTVKLDVIVKETLKLVQFQLKKQTVTLDFIPGPEIEIVANQTMLEQAFLNLYLNAIEAMPQGGTLTVHVQVENNMGLVTIRDTGEGIPYEIRDKIYEPFVTSKSEGTGLGLFIVKSIILMFHGSLDYQSKNNGTVFNIRFPLNGAKKNLD
jgi:signal transduction histidine kinase